MLNLSSTKNRWLALVVLAMSLAIVIIDNNVLNVAIPYILHDLNASLDQIQWVVSGYALIIATLLITVGRIGDLISRKKIFLLGAILFAIGSFIASISQNAYVLFLGEAFIEAIGASMMLTSSLSLIASEFQGKERAIAFGIWGSVAGAAASIGPLLGGYLTTYYSWRWSLRINVFVAILTIIGSVFVKESKGETEKRFDFSGMILSGLGLTSLVFGFIEGQTYGWRGPIPFAFALAIISLVLFILNEFRIENSGGSPLLRPSLFKNRTFSLSLLILMIISLGQFGVFFIMPIYLQNVLNLTAFQTGLVFLGSSISILIFGPLSGFIASKIGTRWVINIGMIVNSLGILLLIQEINPQTTPFSLLPSFVLLGIGIGMTGSQLTNTTLSSVPVTNAGEASAANTTVRQVGTSVGTALIGVVLASSLLLNINNTIIHDNKVPTPAKGQIINRLQNLSIEQRHQSDNLKGTPLQIKSAVDKDIHLSLIDSAKDALTVALFFVLLGTLVLLMFPINTPPHEKKEEEREEQIPLRRNRVVFERA